MGETAEVETVETESESPDMSQAEADMEAGFADEPAQTDESAPAAGIESPADVTDAEDGPPAGEITPESTHVQLTQAEYQRLLQGVETVEKLASTLEQRFGTAFGHIGGLQQKLKEMQAETPAGQAVQLTAEDFAEMQAEFPELAEMTRKSMERALSKIRGTGAGLNEEKASALFDGKLDRFRKELAKEALSDLHEDWREVVGPTEAAWAEANPGQPYQPSAYRTWLATQPAEYQAKLKGSWRPGLIAQSITKYKQFVAEQAATKPTTPTSRAAQIRRQQLASAVTPKGSSAGPRASRTDEDDLMAGWNNA